MTILHYYRYPDNIAQERKVLQEVIALLDVKNEQMYSVMAAETFLSTPVAVTYIANDKSDYYLQ